jgi:hypothetical protein
MTKEIIVKNIKASTKKSPYFLYKENIKKKLLLWKKLIIKKNPPIFYTLIKNFYFLHFNKKLGYYDVILLGTL